MKRVLIVFSVSHQKALVDSVVKNVSDNDLIFDSFDINKWQLYSHDQRINYSWYRKIITYKCGLPILGSLISRINTWTHLLFDCVVLSSLFKKYDIIDFHYYDTIYYPLLKMAYHNGIKIKLHHWGSDILRATEETKHQLLTVYNYCDVIQVATKPMRDAVIAISQSAESKVEVLHFGNAVLSYNNQHFNETPDTSFLGDKIDGKIVLTCGYNGSTGQQHLKMISCVNNLPLETRRKLFVIVPMTYGGTSSYIERVRNAMSGYSYDFTIIENRISEIQLFDLRRVTDIAFNIQKTDAFSGSLQEHIQCGNVLLVGDWLNYDIMKDAGIYYLTTSEQALYENLLSTIDNLEEHKRKCAPNEDLIIQLCSWENLAPKWRGVYKSIYHS